VGISKVSFFNLALGHIGVKPITLPTKDTPAALALGRAWDASRRETFAMGPLSCALVIENLAEVSGFTFPTTDWTYFYQYPSKALRIWKTYNESTTDKKKGEDHKVVFDPTSKGRIVLSNTEEVVCEYAYDNEDTNTYDPTTIVAMSFVLAANVVMELVSDQKVALSMMQAFQQKASEMFRLDATEQNFKISGETTLLEARGT